MTETLNPLPEAQPPSESASATWTSPELQVLSIAETAATSSNLGDDGVFFS